MFLFALLIPPGWALTQDVPEAREPRAVISPYSAEEAATVSVHLAQEEARLRAMIPQQPRSAEPLYSLALVMRQEGKARESIDTYTQAAQLRTPTADDLRSVALDYVLLSDYDDAIHWLERAVRMDPANVNALYSLGRCYFSKGRYLDAEHMFAHILAIDPKHLKAEENLGLVFDATNHPKQAEEALRTAASRASKEGPDEWPFLDLGGFLLDRDRAQDAIDPLRTAVHIRPDCAACHEKLGRALLATRGLAEGITELERAVQLDPSNPKTHYELGRALRRDGQAEWAQQEFAASQKLYAAHSQE
jgi:tetratricopeptide (TPR) repeat protein